MRLVTIEGRELVRARIAFSAGIVIRGVGGHFFFSDRYILQEKMRVGAFPQP